MAIGKKIFKETRQSLAATLQKDAANMPYFLLQASRLANTLITGRHGQHKRGNGENFWQFRPYVQGESITHIDWRRSARDEHTYLREREWEMTQTVWIWPDQSASMQYCSCFSKISKGNHAIILSLALAKLLAKSGEHIAIPGLMAPTISSNVMERMALALTNHQVENSFPNFSIVTRFSQVIIMSDFLDHPEKIIDHLTVLATKQVNAHLIEVTDPAEEHFPYTGHIEFFDPETKEKLLVRKAENLRKNYHKLYQERRQKLTEFCSHQGWTYQVSLTNRPLTEIIVHLANKMKASKSYLRRSL
ncbi:conserved protein of unknown function [Bartonella clarridgeiae 73]|uniref:DUF58 domain-containing protein n=1 Tax=Bartonella clarridgeiae (strain CCUG 45776 / CIP 104772 / 73) TaxID=696125 RepID=E6YGJ8_BARC7|nr:DUF58 domain-containing protein [Bartonella clarridgeiae]WCR55414.1 MAG: putative conserved membrane protein [Bartonella clarridgeiae]CBI75986.1 conserved protein of unknown function [Bartonella clarridgeiae 73]